MTRPPTRGGPIAGPDDVHLAVLPSGLRVVTERLPGSRTVSVGAWVGVGARDEPGELAGVSHFLEHLLFKGTESRSAREIAMAVDAVGGDMNAFTAKEYTAFYCRLPAQHLRLGIELLGEVVSSPALRDADVEAERQVILEELAMDEDLAEDRVHVLLAEALFPGHPLGRDTAGTPETVAAVTPEDIRAFFRDTYRPRNTVVAAAGDLDHGEVVALAAAAFRSEPGGRRPGRSAPPARVLPQKHLRRSCEQAHLAVGFRGLDRHDPDRWALEVLNHVLGGGPSSRLFQVIREERGLAYSVYSQPAAYEDAGALGIYVGTGLPRAGEVLGLVHAEIRRFATGGITDEELAVASGYLEGSLVLGLEDSGSRMARLATSVTVRDDVLGLDEHVARYRAVTPSDVTRVARRVLGSPGSLAVVGPFAGRTVTSWRTAAAG